MELNGFGSCGMVLVFLLTYRQSMSYLPDHVKSVEVNRSAQDLIYTEY